MGNTVLLLLCVTYFLLHIVHCRDVLPQLETYSPDYNYYHNLTLIYKQVKTLATTHASYVKVDWSYLSRDGLSQPVLRISDFTSTHETESPVKQHIFPDRVKILLSFGEHAREFLPVETLLTFLSYISSELKSEELDSLHTSRIDLSKLDIFIVAMLNPDGRHLVETTQNYCWRGTGNGVDLNRNFNWNFGGKGSSGNPEDEEYRGSSPFSEPEGRVLQELTQFHKIDAFVSFHSGIRQMYIPYADTVSKKKRLKPDNLEGMMNLCRRLSQVIKHSFKYGPADKVNDYTADGTIFDFMAGNRKIPFSIAIELWGNGNSKQDSCFDLFNPHSLKLKTATEELLPMYIALFQFMVEWKQNQISSWLKWKAMIYSHSLICTCVVLLLLIGLYNYYRHRKKILKYSFRTCPLLKLSSQSLQYFYLVFYKLKYTLSNDANCHNKR